MATRSSDAELSERELLIARKAAQLAVQQITDEFYKGVGKTVITRVLIIIGAFFGGLAFGKGWLTFLVK